MTKQRYSSAPSGPSRYSSGISTTRSGWPCLQERRNLFAVSDGRGAVGLARRQINRAADGIRSRRRDRLAGEHLFYRLFQIGPPHFDRGSATARVTVVDASLVTELARGVEQ